MSLNSFFVLCVVLILAALLQHSSINFLGAKPLWVLSALIPMLIVSKNYYASAVFILFSAFLLRTTYFIESEIVYFVAFSVLLLIVKRYFFHHEVPLLYGSVLLAGAGFAVFSPYPFWYEAVYNIIIASVVFIALRKIKYEAV